MVNKEVWDMLKMGVIEPFNSAWHNPIVLVPKPVGSVRYCIDFREMNKLAKFNAYTMPRTELWRSQLGDTLYMSTLDLITRYWQVSM